MTLLVMTHPEKLRERMAELKGAEHDHTNWVSTWRGPRSAAVVPPALTMP